MQDEHRRAIQNNFSSLVEQTDLDQMVSSLYEKGVFSEAMIEPYKDINRDVRTRKRQLYRDIERRGPNAFNHLIETLTELGHWDLVRVLQPDSVLHPRQLSRHEREAEPISLKGTRAKNKAELQECRPNNVPFPLDFVNTPSSREEIPKFNVVKSQKFTEETNSGFPIYKSRSTKRGLLLAFSFIAFQNNIEKYRRGAEVDCKNLKYLFNEIGFPKVIFYNNLTKAEMENTIRNLNEMSSLEKMECVFVVVSSHGYENLAHSDTDIRCSDGGLISSRNIIEHFNNHRCPRLRGVPKVFIFQTCRGNSWDNVAAAAAGPHTRAPAPAPESDGSAGPTRLYSDILIANSTLPGFVSLRDPENGSWYIQALCEVFAERAHDCHVEDLFKLVDRTMEERFHVQTSSVDNWGFNSRLYLHPGLFDKTI